MQMTILQKAVLFGLSLFALISVLLTIPTEEKFASDVDEGYYRKYASCIAGKGMSVFPEFARAYIDNPDESLNPAPVRVGHMLMTGLWFRLFPNTFVWLARFSWLCFAIFLVVSYVFARRHFGADMSCLLLALWACSPLFMGMGRRALSDMHGNLSCGLSVWLLLEFFTKRSRIVYVCLIVSFAYAVLVRESAVFLIPVAVITWMINRHVYGNSMPVRYIAGIVVGPPVIICATYAAVFGMRNGVQLVGAVINTHFNIAEQTSWYAINYCAGPWYRYIIDFMLLSPVTVLLFLGYLGHKILMRRMEWREAFFMVYFAVFFILLGNLKYGKVVRFVINLDMVVSLFAVVFLLDFFRNKRVERQWLWAWTVVVVIFFFNYCSFTNIFCIRGVYDPISAALLSARGFIP